MNIKLCALPTLGSKGYWRFIDVVESAIFNIHGINTEKTPLSLIGITSFKELINNSQIDPLADIYLTYGLTEINFHEDYRNEEALLVFEHAGLNETVRFTLPINYIITTPTLTHISYLRTAMVVDIGFLPEGIDFVTLRGEVQELVEGMTGIQNTEIKQVQYGAPDYVDIEQHESRTMERENLQTIQNTYRSLFQKLQNDFNRLKQSYDDLVSRLIPPP